MKLFPFTAVSYNSTNQELSRLFRENKPEGETYYDYDLIVHSKKEIEFVAFGMFDNFHGGRGKEKYRFKVTVKPKDTKRYIDQHLKTLATYEVERMERDILTAKIDSGIATLRAAFNL